MISYKTFTPNKKPKKILKSVFAFLFVKNKVKCYVVWIRNTSLGSSYLAETALVLLKKKKKNLNFHAIILDMTK